MYIEHLKTPIGLLRIEANNNFVLAIRLVTKACSTESANSITNECVKQLSEYFLGVRLEFSVPLAFEGTDFQKKVWHKLISLKYGETCSYSDIAEAIESGPRAVGSANRVNKIPIIVPCHRVIGKNKELTGYALGLDKKAWLLTHENRLHH